MSFSIQAELNLFFFFFFWFRLLFSLLKWKKYTTWRKYRASARSKFILVYIERVFDLLADS